jgi:transcriptional regulator with XRE-family HTH domain
MGWTRAELARQLKVDRATIWRWETDEKKIDQFRAAFLVQMLRPKEAAE